MWKNSHAINAEMFPRSSGDAAVEFGNIVAEMFQEIPEILSMILEVCAR